MFAHKLNTAPSIRHINNHVVYFQRHLVVGVVTSITVRIVMWLWVLSVTNTFDDSLETVDFVSCIFDDASGAIGLGEGIRSWKIILCQCDLKLLNIYIKWKFKLNNSND